MKQLSRCEVKKLISACKSEKKPLILCGVSQRVTAIGCEAGGADLLLQYSCAYGRSRGLSGC